MEHGADFVEVDIQLSKDMVPVIYHDFHVSIALRKKDVIDDHHLLTVPLKDLEYTQLQQLKVLLQKAERMSQKATIVFESFLYKW